MVKYSRSATITLIANQSNVISEAKQGKAKRVVFEVTNNEAIGGADVFMAIDQEPAANIGRRIQPGQDKGWDTNAAYMPPQGQITAFSTAAVVLSIYEEVE